MSLYGWVILLSFAGPFALSFDKKVAFFLKNGETYLLQRFA